MALTDKLSSIGDAIRAKTGKTEKLSLEQMPDEIRSIETGEKVEQYLETETYSSINLVKATLHGYIIPYANMFSGQKYLQTVNFEGIETSISDSMFNGCSSITEISIPATVTSIDTNGFYLCGKLKSIVIPENVTSIKSSAFRNCNSLASATFKGTPSLISSDVFKNDTNLTVINVPWSEGEVANAPWGATNATINYNYVESEETA